MQRPYELILCKRAVIGMIVMVAISLNPRTSRGSIFDDIGEKISEVSGLRGAIRGLASGAGEGLRTQLERLIDDKINPLLDRANALVAQRLDQVDQIMAARITQASDEMMKALLEAEIILNDVIDHAGRVSIKVADRVIDGLFKRVDPLMNEILCALAPTKRGLQITGIPFIRAPDSIRVRRPARTHCYRQFLAYQYDKNPASQIFDGWQFFLGEMCEVEVNAGEISPSDPQSLQKLKLAYERLAGLAASAICYAPTPTSRSELLTRELQFEKRVQMFSRLIDGSSVLINSQR